MVQNTPPPTQIYPNLLKTFLYLAAALIAGIFCYIILLNLALWIYPQTIIFFFSCVAVFFLSIFFFVLSFQFFHYDFLISSLMALNLGLFLLIFAIFGPVFIDRSISYHIAFIVSEEGSVDPKQLEKQWGTDIIAKRMDDGVVAQMFKKQNPHSYTSTGKSEFFTFVMLNLGKMTRTLHNYENLKDKYYAKNDS